MLEKLTTEQRNPASQEIDRLSSLEIVRVINGEDATVPEAVGREAESIARAIDAIASCLQNRGRLIYVGAGTSGRLGVLDASECPPTFNTDPKQVIGIIAGGYGALSRSVEGAEDYPEHARRDLEQVAVCAADCVVGIATSGRTPYVIAALEYANSIGALTIGIACNRDSELQAAARMTITPIVGPEVISGSTRMKAGTATKLVLNMLTTGAMVRLGKTYGNLMVDLRATNDKLRIRSRRIVRLLTNLDEGGAEQLLERCDGEVKTAVVVGKLGVSVDVARQRLQRQGGHLRKALEE